MKRIVSAVAIGGMDISVAILPAAIITMYTGLAVASDDIGRISSTLFALSRIPFVLTFGAMWAYTVLFVDWSGRVRNTLAGYLVLKLGLAATVLTST